MSQAITNISLSKSYLRSKLECDISADIDVCNILFSIAYECDKDLDISMLERTGVSGIGVDRNIIDFMALEQLLRSFGNYSGSFDISTLPPSVQKLYKRIVSESDADENTTDRLQNMLIRSPIRSLTKILTHYGIVYNNFINASMLCDNKKIFGIVTNGQPPTANSNFNLHLPYANTMKFDNCLKFADTSLRVYIVLGPFDEILCGEAHEMFIPRQPEESVINERKLISEEIEDITYSDIHDVPFKTDMTKLTNEYHLHMDKKHFVHQVDTKLRAKLLDISTDQSRLAYIDYVYNTCIDTIGLGSESKALLSKTLTPLITWNEKQDKINVKFNRYLRNHVLYYQPYTCVFILVPSYESVENVFQRVYSRCLIMNAKKKLRSRIIEIATSEIGTVTSMRDFTQQSDSKGGIKLNNFSYTPFRQWICKTVLLPGIDEEPSTESHGQEITYHFPTSTDDQMYLNTRSDFDFTSENDLHRYHRTSAEYLNAMKELNKIHMAVSNFLQDIDKLPLTMCNYAYYLYDKCVQLKEVFEPFVAITTRYINIIDSDHYDVKLNVSLKSIVSELKQKLTAMINKLLAPINKQVTENTVIFTSDMLYEYFKEYHTKYIEIQDGGSCFSESNCPDTEYEMITKEHRENLEEIHKMMECETTAMLSKIKREGNVLVEKVLEHNTSQMDQLQSFMEKFNGILEMELAYEELCVYLNHESNNMSSIIEYIIRNAEHRLQSILINFLTIIEEINMLYDRLVKGGNIKYSFTWQDKMVEARKQSLQAKEIVKQFEKEIGDLEIYIMTSTTQVVSRFFNSGKFELTECDRIPDSIELYSREVLGKDKIVCKSARGSITKPTKTKTLTGSVYVKKRHVKSSSDEIDVKKRNTSTSDDSLTWDDTLPMVLHDLQVQGSSGLQVPTDIVSKYSNISEADVATKSQDGSLRVDVSEEQCAMLSESPFITGEVGGDQTQNSYEIAIKNQNNTTSDDSLSDVSFDILPIEEKDNSGLEVPTEIVGKDSSVNEVDVATNNTNVTLDGSLMVDVGEEQREIISELQSEVHTIGNILRSDDMSAKKVNGVQRKSGSKKISKQSKKDKEPDIRRTTKNDITQIETSVNWQSC